MVRRDIKQTMLVLLAACLLMPFYVARATGTTHIWAPSADVQPFRIWHITGDFYVPVETDDEGNHIATVTNVGLTVGILPFKKLNMEIGFDHKSGMGISDNHPLYGNAKIGVPENAYGRVFPAIAVGILDVGTKKYMTDYNVFYAKAARTISVGQISLGRVSLGYFTGAKKLLVDENLKKDNSGLMAAWECTMTELSEKLWLCVDYMGTKSVYGCWNIGASWKFAPKVSLLGGYELFDNQNLINTVTLQFDIDI